jgi:hypothetical protein
MSEFFPAGGSEEARPIFLLAKDDVILTGQGEPLRMTPKDIRKTPAGMAYPAELDANWQTAAGNVHLSVTDPKVIEATDFLASVPSWLRFFVKWFTQPYYLRFNATLALSVEMGDIHAEARGLTLFELMSFE